MKIISSLQGTVALQVSGDEVMPERGLNVRDLITFLRNTYQFSIFPQFAPNTPQVLMQNLSFQSGTFISDDKKLPIHQLAMVPNGDLVTAQRTEDAEIIIEDLTKRMDSDLGYRYGTASKKDRVYQSDLVVQFDGALEDKIQGIKKIQEILGREIKAVEPYAIKRLAFGFGEVVAQVPFELIGRTDFMLERRTGTQYSENRYFSAAPLKTPDHIRLLETLERELAH